MSAGHPPPTILLDDAVEHMGKVDLRWQQLEVVGKPNNHSAHLMMKHMRSAHR